MIVRIEDIKRCKYIPSVIDATEAEPEMRLKLFELAEAIYGALGLGGAVCRNSRGNRKKRIQQEDIRWMFSDRDGEGTFNYLCEQVNIEPDYIRRKVRELLERKTHVA